MTKEEITEKLAACTGDLALAFKAAKREDWEETLGAVTEAILELKKLEHELLGKVMS